jgi:hypothetical protein
MLTKPERPTEDVLPLGRSDRALSPCVNKDMIIMRPAWQAQQQLRFSMARPVQELSYPCSRLVSTSHISCMSLSKAWRMPTSLIHKEQGTDKAVKHPLQVNTDARHAQLTPMQLTSCLHQTHADSGSFGCRGCRVGCTRSDRAVNGLEPRN